MVASAFRCSWLCDSDWHLWAALNHGCVSASVVSNVVGHGALKCTHLILSIAMWVLHVRRLVIFVAIASLALTEVRHVATLGLLILALYRLLFGRA